MTENPLSVYIPLNRKFIFLNDNCDFSYLLIFGHDIIHTVFSVSYVQAIRTFKHKRETLLAFFEMKGKDISKIGKHPSQFETVTLYFSVYSFISISEIVNYLNTVNLFIFKCKSFMQLCENVSGILEMRYIS